MTNPDTSNQTPLRLSGSAFWDIDLSTLDVERYASFVIIRVFERGTAEDIQHIIRYFGVTKIIDTITSARALAPRALALGIKMFALSTDRFACSKHSPQALNYSMY